MENTKAVELLQKIGNELEGDAQYPDENHIVWVGFEKWLKRFNKR